MENNTQSNVVVEPNKKKNGLVIVIVIVIILALLALVYVRKMNNTLPLTQTEVELNQAVASDTTASINSNLDGINLNDTGSDTSGLQSIDQELNKL
jgi:hypothetical protein